MDKEKKRERDKQQKRERERNNKREEERETKRERERKRENILRKTGKVIYVLSFIGTSTIDRRSLLKSCRAFLFLTIWETIKPRKTETIEFLPLWKIKLRRTILILLPKTNSNDNDRCIEIQAPN